MTKNILLAATCAALFLTSCNKEKNTPETVTANADSLFQPAASPAATTKDDIVKSTAKDSNGKTLDMSFNRTNETATLVFNGETIELTHTPSGSGYSYTNDHYELRGKGSGEKEYVELTKDGKTVFKKDTFFK
ncbi:MliC family protein [Chryseobacterium antibioticum]|uniref:MliC family protein n=1 Tax=Chryseobacterium pyrolae TaxID=2987481 RepID=A0ABT2IL09_9FLAO|nr:MliC family protein [Chryseobacterium pyrolae]MCT2409306.1 MliC family protein [Chryseobacterium pyrolae]